MEVTDIKTKFFEEAQKEELSDVYLIQKYLCHGNSPILNEEKLFHIKHKISCKFGIHPNEVILTGSAKLGFSIAPNKNYRDFNEESDIDIAIISNKLFEKFWFDLLEFNISTTRKTTEEQKLYFEFIEYLFKGWIRPDKFPFSFAGKQEWFKFFNDLTHEIYEYGEHKISAGIYKDFTTFELYNKKNISRVRNEINAGVKYE